MSDRFRDVDPAVLRLPPPRGDGPDALKLHDQTRRYGRSIAGMPPVQVTEGRGGELMINDGVTRACRIAKLNPGTTIPVEVIDRRPDWSLGHLRPVREVV